jgi:hypothetical protein
MALRNVLILRKPRSGCLEGATAIIQPIINSFTSSKAKIQRPKVSAVAPVPCQEQTPDPHYSWL